MLSVSVFKGKVYTVHGFNEEKFNTLLGRLLTLVETLGLPKSQEDAFKSIVKQEVWSLWENPKFIESSKESVIEVETENS